jgi:hypothetical protein
LEWGHYLFLPKARWYAVTAAGLIVTGALPEPTGLKALFFGGTIALPGVKMFTPIGRGVVEVPIFVELVP